MQDHFSIVEYLGEPEVLAQLAEEAAELAQAALKLRRALEGKNPRRKRKRNAVPVVRCRECVSYGADAFGDNCCNYPEGLAFPDGNSYCCYGMRRKEDENNG